MSFARASGFMTPKEVEFLPGKRERRNLLEKNTLDSQELGLNKQTKIQFLN